MYLCLCPHQRPILFSRLIFVGGFQLYHFLRRRFPGLPAIARGQHRGPDEHEVRSECKARGVRHRQTDGPTRRALYFRHSFCPAQWVA